MRILITLTFPNPLILEIKYATSFQSVVLEPITVTYDSALNTGTIGFPSHAYDLVVRDLRPEARMAGKSAQTFVPAKRRPPIPVGRDYFYISIIVRRQSKSLRVHSLITP